MGRRCGGQQDAGRILVSSEQTSREHTPGKRFENWLFTGENKGYLNLWGNECTSLEGQGAGDASSVWGINSRYLWT